MANPNPVTRFTPGNQVARGHGNRSRARESIALKVMTDTVGWERWQAICEQSALDALGKKKVVRKGKEVMVRDPQSTPATRAHAREWLGNYLMGKPDANLFLHNTDSPQGELPLREQVREMTDAELEAMLVSAPGQQPVYIVAQEEQN